MSVETLNRGCNHRLVITFIMGTKSSGVILTKTLGL